MKLLNLIKDREMRGLSAKELDEVSGGRNYFQYGDGVHSPNIVRTKSCNETDSRAAQAHAMQKVDFNYLGPNAGTAERDAAIQGRIEYYTMCGTDRSRSKYDYSKSNFRY